MYVVATIITVHTAKKVSDTAAPPLSDSLELIQIIKKTVHFEECTVSCFLFD
nr:MAG TPA: hypothetical protein [Caudoviricetes sp.]